MKSISAFWAVALTATIAAGCSGGSANAPASFVPAAPAGAAGGISMRNDGRACRKTGGCDVKLMLPLSLNGKSLAVGRFASCRGMSLSSAKPFTATKTHQFTLSSSVTLSPSCLRLTSANSTLFIAVAELGKAATAQLAPLAGPVNPNARPWTFHPVSTGVKMAAKARFAFFVVAVADDPAPSPSPGAPTANFRLLAPMSFDGTTFALTGTCSNDAKDAPVYVAPSDGPLALEENVSVMPACAPAGGDAAAAQLYVVAVRPETSGSQGDSGLLRPHEDGGVPAVAIAGPVNATDSPWSFAPDSPGLTTQAGAGYAFFVAAMVPAAPATPAPPRSFRAIVPLGFDGTTFTVSSMTSCSSFTPPPAYTAPATAALTLTDPVSIAPTCVPSSGGDDVARMYRNDDGGGGPLYIVATVANFESHSIARVRPSDGGGGESIDGIAIAGPVLSTDSTWSFTPLSPALTITQGLQYQFYVAIPN